MTKEKQIEVGQEVLSKDGNGDMSAKIIFSVKTWIAIMTIAWAPAITIGTTMLKWGVSMDNRVTIQEQTNQSIAKTLAKIETSMDQDVKMLRESSTELKSSVRTLERDVAELKAHFTLSEIRK